MCSIAELCARAQLPSSLNGGRSSLSMTGTNFEDDDSPLPSQSHPPLATALFGGIGTVILGVLAVVALLGFGVFKIIQKKLSGSKIRLLFAPG